MSSDVTIRRFEQGNSVDIAAMYEICRLTGPVDAHGHLMYPHARLLGEIYLGPYVALEPKLAFVAVDEHGVAGYIVGALDTAAFEDACERSWWPEKQAQYPEGAFPGSAEERLVHKIHHPERTPAWLMEKFPSHLHIDLLPRLQGKGCGGRLMKRLIQELRESGSAGVHLGVGAGNQNAIGFYEHVGFTTVSRDESALTMALTLSDADDAG